MHTPVFTACRACSTGRCFQSTSKLSCPHERVLEPETICILVRIHPPPPPKSTFRLRTHAESMALVSVEQKVGTSP